MKHQTKKFSWMSCALFLLFLASLPLAAQYSLDCEWISPLPSGNDYHAVWGTSPSNVYFAGQYGILLRFDGTSFSQMSLPSGVTVDQIWSLWGSSASDIYAVGESYETGGKIFRCDGSSWSDVTPGTLGFGLRGVWGAGASAVFAVGNRYWNSNTYTWDNSILFFNGGSWTETHLGASVDLNAVWGSSASDVFAVGSDGAVWHFNGISWSSQTSPTGNTLYAVWGTSGTNVYAVGYNGTVIHYDGGGWSTFASPGSFYLYGIWGESGSDFYAVGSNGRICHWNGGGWSVTDFWGNHFYGIYGFAGTPYFTAGMQGRIMRCDTGTWGQIAPTSRITSQSLNGIWGSSASNIYVTGSSGSIFRFNGSSWIDQTIGGGPEFNRVWGRAADDIYVVGGVWNDPVEYVIYHFDGSGWSQVASGSNYVLYDVWGSASVGTDGKADDVYAVGGTLNISHPPADDYVILHYDGTGWSVADSGSGFHATGIWGSASVDAGGKADDVFVVGQSCNESGGFIRHFDGTSWDLASVAGVELEDVWGSPRVGAGGKANDVFTAGVNGRPYHFDGSAWSEIAHDSNITGQAWALWGAGADSLFFAGGSGPAYFDGTYWAERGFVDSNSNGLNDMWGTSTTDVYAVGAGGCVIHVSLSGSPPTPPRPPVTTNQPPVAVIDGDDFACRPPQSVHLDGTASRDADGTVTAYEWKLASKPIGSSAKLSSASAKAVSLAADLAGRYIVSLRVRDDDGAWSATATHAVTVSAGDPPGLAIQGIRRTDRAWIIRRDYAELTLTSTPPASGCARVISGYRLQRSRAGEALVTVHDLVPGDFTLNDGVLTITLTDQYLERNTSYSYRLAALDENGDEAASATFSL
jgi:hypothetical protein